MRKLELPSKVALVVALVALPLAADTLNGTGGGWTNWSQSTLTNPADLSTSGGPYWNSLSGDGPNYNVGWCLTGGGGCSMPGAPGTPLPFFANGNSALNTMWFSTGGSSVTVTLSGVFTSQTNAVTNGIDYFGYYIVDPTTGNAIDQTRLLAASQPLGSTDTFSLPANTEYGFYLENVQGQGLSDETDTWYYMDSTQDNSNGSPLTAVQHFAIFQGASSLYLGIEDGTDFDYNDMIIGVTADSAPEPVPMALAALGLITFGAIFRRKLQRS